MLTLAANDTLAGVADAANKVTCTIFGMELNPSTNPATETYKVLDQRQLAAAAATIYTATANGPTFIRSISVVNNDTVARTFSLYRGGTGDVNEIVSGQLVAGGFATYEDMYGWRFYSAAGVELCSPFSGNFPLAYMSPMPSGIKAENMPRALIAETNTTGPATGVIWACAIYLYAGMVVNNLIMATATTAIGTPTHGFIGLYDTSGNLLATTADQTSTAWAANTMKAIAVTTPYTVPTSGTYLIAFGFTATTMPTWKGNTAKTDGALAAATPTLFGASATAYSTGTGPNPISVAYFGTKVTWSIWVAVS